MTQRIQDTHTRTHSAHDEPGTSQRRTRHSTHKRHHGPNTEETPRTQHTTDTTDPTRTPTHTSTRTLARTPHTPMHTHTNAPHNTRHGARGTRRAPRPTARKTTHHAHKTQRTELRSDTMYPTHEAYSGPNTHTHTHHITARGHSTRTLRPLITSARSCGSKPARSCARAADIKTTLGGQCRSPQQTRCNPPTHVFDWRYRGCRRVGGCVRSKYCSGNALHARYIYQSSFYCTGCRVMLLFGLSFHVTVRRRVCHPCVSTPCQLSRCMSAS